MPCPRVFGCLGLLALCAVSPLSAHADAPPTVTLASLVEAGQRNHPTLAKQPLLAHSLALQREQLNRAYWPQLSANGTASWQSDVTSVDVPLPGVTLPTPNQDQYKLALELQQSLWDGGVTADKKRVADRRSRVEQHKVTVEWHQVRDRIVQLYYAGLVQQDLRAQALVLQQRLQTVVDSAQLALDNGLATERDVLLARARRLEARQAEAEASAQLAGVHRALGELTGGALPEGAALAPAPQSCSGRDARAVTADALRRPELSMLTAQTELLTAQEQLERAPDQPRLSAFATAGYGRPGLNVLSDQFDFLFIGGLRLNVPLTYLYADTHGQAREQLAIQRSLVERQRDALMMQINVELGGQRTELERLDASIALDTEVLEVRERSREQTERQLELGTATVADLIGDLTLEDQARTRLAVHHTQRNHACHQVALIKGKP